MSDKPTIREHIADNDKSLGKLQIVTEEYAGGIKAKVRFFGMIPGKTKTDPAVLTTTNYKKLGDNFQTMEAVFDAAKEFSKKYQIIK